MVRRWLLLIALVAFPALAQVDFTGEWAPRYFEDQPERIPGPELGDYLGIPLNDALRLRADSWDAGLQSLPEHQCIPHPSTYAFRGPANLRVSKEADPVTEDIVSYTIYGTFGRATRVIWMDGRPRPPREAAHTWAGFSLGHWDGNMLTVETTHLKAGYIRRNGVVHSDLATMTEHFIRHGGILTIVTMVSDPVYLTEPFMRSTDFVMDLSQHASATPCDATVEAVQRKGVVPHHLPGTNQFVAEFATRWKIPFAATRGGAATMYPEYRTKLANLPTEPRASFAEESVSPGVASNDVRILPVRGNVSMLTVAGVNLAVSAGPEGVLLVDAGPAESSGRIIAAVQKLTAKPIRYILNTNADPDHAGGNAALAKMGRAIGAGGAGSALFADIAGADPRAEVVAHLNVLNRMSSQPPNSWPTITFFSDSKDLFFNNEAVQMLHQPVAHSDGDSLVFFRRSDVIATGDLFDTTTYPRIDLARGGTIQGVIDGLNRIIELTVPAAQQEGGTMVVPGHGRLCDEADVVEYRDMVTILRDRILDMVQRGMTLEQVKAARPTRDYDGRYGALEGAWTTEMFVEAVYRSLGGSRMQACLHPALRPATPASIY